MRHACGSWSLVHGEVAREDGTAVVGGPDHPLFLLNCDPEEVLGRDIRKSGGMRSFLHAYQQVGVPTSLHQPHVTPGDDEDVTWYARCRETFLCSANDHWTRRARPPWRTGP